MNTSQLSKPYIPNNNRVNERHSGSRALIPIGKYLHSLSLPLRLAPPNVNTFTLEQVNITEWSKKTIRIIRLPNISGINRNFCVLEAMSQMFG